MRYWFFDGNDVIGPFLPQELAARTDFSAASMLAPETESENQNAWAMAASFADFKFNEQTGLMELPDEKIIFSTNSAGSPLPAAAPGSSAQPPLQPLKPQSIKPVALAKPIELAKSTEDILPLPEQPEPEDAAKPAVEEKDSAPAADTSSDKAEEKPQETLQEKPQETPQENTTAQPAVQDEVLSTCTLPTVDQAAQVGAAGAWTEQEDALRQMLENSAPAVANAEEQKPDETVPPEEISTREVVKPNLPVTTEIDAFLQAQQAAHQPRSHKAALMLWILLILLLPGIVALAIRWAPRGQMVPPKTTTALENSVPEDSAIQTAEKGSVSSATPEKEAAAPAVTAPAKPTVSDQAINIVKDYQLSGNKGTISSYFSRLYKTQLSSGYREEWSAEPLHKSVYIVKYRLTKTRTEPIVYVFQVDVSKGKLTSALNNIALDLVGKI